jgi:cytochrome c-type biogenesis protein CcsB
MQISFFNDYQLPIIACFFLFISMILYWISLSIPTNNLIFKISRTFVFISNILFFLTLSIRWVTQGYFPLSNLYESLIFLCCCISAIHLYIESKTQSRLIGSLIVPLLFFLSSFSSLTLPTDMQKALPLVPSLQSNWLMMHVSMMMLSYSVLIIGSLFSILYLFFEMFQPKNIEFNSNGVSTQLTLQNTSQMNLLQTVDIWSYRIIGLGFPFLTIGIISGAVWANEAWGSYWSWDPKETWALITWIVFAAYIHARLSKGWVGEKAALLGSLGFIVVWICYLGTNFLGQGLHSYGFLG